MKYLMWESNPWLSVHEADTLPTELTKFLYLPSRVRTDDLQNYSLMLYQLSYWLDQVQEQEKFFKNEKRRDAHAQSKLKSMQNNHIKDFPNHLPYLVIFRNDIKHIDDVDHLQNNTPFIEVYSCEVRFEPTTFRTSV